MHKSTILMTCLRVQEGRTNEIKALERIFQRTIANMYVTTCRILGHRTKDMIEAFINDKDWQLRFTMLNDQSDDR